MFKFEPVTDAQGRYALNTVLRFDQIGVWQVELAFAGNNKLAASQKKQQITVNKAEGQLEFLSAESAELGQDYQLIGALSPALEGETLSLKILGPDASVQEAELSSQTQGGFKHQFKLNQQGRWSATVSWAGSDTFQQVSQTFQLNVVKRFGKVILALGGLGPAEGQAWTKFNSVAESVYKTFVRRNFSPQKDIYFLSPDPNQTEGAQAETTLKTLEYAITSWAAQEVNQNVPLYIYLLSHNLRDKFLVQRRGIEDDYLTPEQLDLWLDLLPAETAVTVIIEACYSGNFINSRLSAPNRTIITSASADKQAMIMRSSSFSRYFFDRIGGNQTMAEAFERTQQQMQKMATHRAQNPQIDVNGNAVSNELLDLRALGQRRIPADISSLSLPPAFASQLAAQTISQGESPTLEVELVGSNLDQVLVEIVPPSFDANAIFQDWQQAEQRIKEVDLTAVEGKTGQTKYQLKYDGFDQVGEYQLIFQASNLDGFATPMQSTVTVTETGHQADGRCQQ